MVLVYAGRRPGQDFPLQNVGRVRAELEALIAELHPRLAIGSAAAGADLLVADIAQRAGADVLLYLAGQREKFQRGSVADKGPEWASAFDSLLERDGVAMKETPLGSDPEASYRAVTKAIVQAVMEHAELGEEIVLCAVFRPRPGATDHTAEMVEQGRSRGWRILEVDPFQGSGASGSEAQT